MTVPYTVVVIKPASINRNYGPLILEDMVSKLPVSLRFFRKWNICNTTLKALNIIGTFYNNGKGNYSWICLFTHKDRETDPTIMINDLFGPEAMDHWRHHHLRFRYSSYKEMGQLTHPSDTVVWIPPESRMSICAQLLFQNFNEEEL